MYRSRETLTRWLSEFRATRADGDLLRVAAQDGSGGADTGLVIVPLLNASTTVYMQPLPENPALWAVTFEPQPDPISLDCEAMSALVSELAVAADLCTFLEAKSAGHVEVIDV